MQEEMIMEEIVPKPNKFKLYLGGDKDKHRGWVKVFSGVNVIEYEAEHQALRNTHTFMILPIGDVLHVECYGAFDRSKHKLPY